MQSTTKNASLKVEGFSTGKKETKEEKLVLAFPAHSPKMVKYAKKPPNKIDGQYHAQYEEIPTEEFAKQNGFQSVNSMLLSPEHRDEIWKNKNHPRRAISYVEERLHNPLEWLLVAEIPSIKVDGADYNIGKALFLSPDAPQPLPVGTIIGIYPGKIRELMEEPSDHYALSLREKEHDSIMKEFFKMPTVSSKNYGNILRFAQDKPSEEELKEVKNLSPTALSNITTANLAVYPTVHYGCPISFLITLREVKAGEELAFPYGGSWEESGFTVKQKRAVSNINGEIIGHFTNKNHIELLPSYQPSIEMKAPRINYKLTQECLKPMLLNPSIDTFDYEKRFIENVNYSLEIFLARFQKDSEPTKLIEILKTTLKAKNKTGEKFNEIHKILKGNETFIKENLNTLRSEIIFHMNKYKEGKPENKSEQDLVITFQKNKIQKEEQQKPTPTHEELSLKLKEKMKKK